MPGSIILRWSLPLAVMLTSGASPALAHDSRTGGASMPAPPAVESLRCADGTAFACGQGERLIVRGEGLTGTRSVTFLGGPGGRDDRGARPRRRAAHRVEVDVPADAVPGPVRVLRRSRAGRSDQGRAGRSTFSRPRLNRPSRHRPAMRSSRSKASTPTGSQARTASAAKAGIKGRMSSRTAGPRSSPPNPGRSPGPASRARWDTTSWWGSRTEAARCTCTSSLRRR